MSKTKSTPANKPAKIAYTLDLTHDEAVALLMLQRAGGGRGFVWNQVSNIAEALIDADPFALDEAQYTKWELSGEPHFDFKDDGEEVIL